MFTSGTELTYLSSTDVVAALDEPLMTSTVRNIVSKKHVTVPDYDFMTHCRCLVYFLHADQFIHEYHESTSGGLSICQTPSQISMTFILQIVTNPTPSQNVM